MEKMAIQGEQYWTEETLIYARPHPRLRFMAKQLCQGTPRRLLDIGCSAATLRDLLPADFVYFGCDITDHAAQRLPPGHFLQADFNRGDGLSFFKERTIEAIHIGGVLEYLHQPKTLLREARSLVPTNAPLLLSMINFQGERYRETRQHHPGWVFKPTLEEIRFALVECGWQVDRVWPFSEREGVKSYWFHGWAGLLGPHHPWIRQQARQYILQTHAV